MSSGKIWGWSVLFSVIILLTVYLIFGFYLEDNESIIAAINYGVLGRMGADQLYSDYHTFCLPALYYCSRFFPTVPIYGIWNLLHEIVIVTVLIYYIYRELLFNGVVSKINLLIAVLVLVYLIVDSLVFQHCIRQSILLGFAALLLNWQTIEYEKKTSLAGVFVFLLAVVTRMHAATIVLILFLGFHLFRGMPLRAIIKHHLPMAVIGFGFILFYQMYGVYTANMGKYIESHYEYAILEKPSLQPLATMKTERDTVKYVSLQNFFITDSAEFTKAFFEKVVDLSPSAMSAFSVQTLHHATLDLKNKFSECKYMLLICPFILAILLFGAFSAKKMYATFLIGFLALGVLVLLLFGLVDDIKIRFFSPYLGMSLFVMFIINMPSFFKRWEAKAKYVTVTTLFVFAGIRSFKLVEVTKVDLQKEQQVAVASKQLDSYASKHPLLFFMGAEIPFSNNPFYRTPSSRYNNMATFDGGYLVYFSYLRNKFEGVFTCSPLNYPALVDLFERNPEIRFYATPDRLELVTSYFDKIYNTKLYFERQNPPPHFNLNGGIYKVTVKRGGLIN